MLCFHFSQHHFFTCSIDDNNNGLNMCGRLDSEVPFCGWFISSQHPEILTSIKFVLDWLGDQHLPPTFRPKEVCNVLLCHAFWESCCVVLNVSTDSFCPFVSTVFRSKELSCLGKAFFGDPCCQAGTCGDYSSDFFFGPASLPSPGGLRAFALPLEQPGAYCRRKI